MIQYVPIEEAFVEGRGLYFIHCIWVHGHKQGRGNFQRQGHGDGPARRRPRRTPVNSGPRAWPPGAWPCPSS
ncbi:MAG: hypothetical protein M0C28_02155 [Candidatus Moduliflexus flocculans]|nr:hypothetical protein [Candidatus Moduliflexus flocculans]